MAYTTGLWLFIIPMIIYTALIVSSFRIRATRPGRAFLVLLSLAIIWNLGFILETAALTRELKMVLTRVQFIPICLLPVTWVYLTAAFLGYKITLKHVLMLLVVPSATLSILWFVPPPNWFWGDPQVMYYQAPFPVMDYDYQWWYHFVNLPYDYMLFAAAFVMLIRGLFTMHPIYRMQALLLLAAIILPLTVNLLYNLGISPVPHYNYTTAVFSISGLLIAWSLFRYKFLDLVPTARDTVIEQMDDGVIVVDMKHRIVDINPAARSITGSHGPLAGTHLSELQEKTIWSVLEELTSSEMTRAQVEIDQDGRKVFDLQISFVSDKTKIPTGMIITLRDTTERAELFDKVHTLASQDSLTGLLNRRRLIELGSEYLSQGKPMSMIMIDVDKFKVVNDTYGHEAGDKILIMVSEFCIKAAKKHHLAGRIGGDEFAVILMDTKLPAALPVAERLNLAIQAAQVKSGRKNISVTVSAGVSSTSLLDPDEKTLEQLFSLADRAMYQAKIRGRNQVLSAEFLVREPK